MRTFSKTLLVLLRIVIGWHFLYEGFFKIDSEAIGRHYLTSRYPVQAATARLRDSFTAPPALDSAPARIDQWHDEIVRHFQNQNNPLDESQKARLALLRDRLTQQAVAGELEGIAGIDWYFVHDEVLKLTDQQGPQHFTSLEYLQASAGPFRGLFRGLVPDIEGIERLTARSVAARLDERHNQVLEHYRSRGHAFTDEQTAELAAARDRLKETAAATLGEHYFQARLADYKTMLERVRRDAALLTAPYSRERLSTDRERLDVIAGELMALVNEPVVELTFQAQSLASLEQMKAGPPPRPREQTELLDWMVKWGLVAIGACLLLGLFTPLAAVGAGALLAVFYFASPPWPGLPAAMTGGHYLYVDRNLIELVAVLLLATLPTGQWAGLDFWLRRLKPTVAQAFQPVFAVKNPRS